MKTNLITSYRLLAVVGLTFWLSACAVDKTVAPVVGTPTMPVSVTDPTKTFDLAGQKLLLQGTFAGAGRYSVKGTTKIYEKAGVQTIVFENFTADGGPDLRIYLAEEVSASNFVEVAKLTTSGNFFLTIPAGYDPVKHRTALIWCKQFNVPFGSATIK